MVREKWKQMLDLLVQYRFEETKSWHEKEDRKVMI